MKLGVNVDHVATLRQARLPVGRQEAILFTDPVQAALISEKSGAHSIVMHLREDRRHIQDADLFRAKKEISIKLNMEMSIAPSIVQAALKLKPDQVTLVPEKRLERTTEGGLNLFKKTNYIRHCIDRMKSRGIVCSLFIDPDRRQVEMAKKLQADAVEFHTGDYANQTTVGGAKKELRRLNDAVILARAMQITPHAGHGLDYKNVQALKKIRGIEELNIGYAIVTRAVWVGLDQAVREMLRLIR